MGNPYDYGSIKSFIKKKYKQNKKFLQVQSNPTILYFL